MTKRSIMTRFYSPKRASHQSVEIRKRINFLALAEQSSGERRMDARKPAGVVERAENTPMWLCER